MYSKWSRAGKTFEPTKAAVRHAAESELLAKMEGLNDFEQLPQIPEEEAVFQAAQKATEEAQRKSQGAALNAFLSKEGSVLDSEDVPVTLAGLKKSSRKSSIIC